MKITRDEAIDIARRDALTIHRDLTPYELIAVEADGRWQVTLAVKDRESQGGGAVYMIAEDSGAILERRYFQ